MIIFETSQVQRQQESLLQLQRHVRQLCLSELQRGEWSVEHLTRDGVVDGGFQTVSRRAERTEDDAESGLVQAGERSAQTSHGRKHSIAWQADVLQYQLGGYRSSQRQLLGDLGGRES